jgi:hypothetical protein
MEPYCPYELVPAILETVQEGPRGQGPKASRLTPAQPRFSCRGVDLLDADGKVQVISSKPRWADIVSCVPAWLQEDLKQAFWQLFC